MPNSKQWRMQKNWRGRKRRWESNSCSGDTCDKRRFLTQNAVSPVGVNFPTEPLPSCSNSQSERVRCRGGRMRDRGNRIQHDRTNGGRNEQARLRECQSNTTSSTCPHPNLTKSKHGKRPIASQTAPESSSSSSNSSQSDIPGFYYDAEKKRYFKILPSHNNVNVVTRESVSSKTAEEKRINDLKLQSNSKLGQHDKDAKPQRTESVNFIHFWQRVHQGDVTNTSIEPFVLKSQVRKLKLSHFERIFSNPFGNYEQLEHMLLMEASSDFHDILGLWSVKDTLVHRIQLLRVNVKKRTSEHKAEARGLEVEINPQGNVVLQSLNKVTHACWAPSLENPNRKYILYTTVCYTGYSSSLALFRNLEPGGNADCRATDFCLGKKATWTCAWNPHHQRFSVGTEKSGLLLDVETRRLWELYSNKSDVLTQTFTRTTGQSLISGTRKGEILTHDLRSRSTHPVKVVHQQSPIGSLRLLKDDIYLLASDFKGQINLWDLRMRKVVREYPGHTNRYSKLFIHMEESEQVLYTVGEDCYTRFWSVRTGELLRSIPPPCPASRDLIPRVLYSSSWAGQWGQVGMMMGLKDKMYMYHSQDAGYL
ncbi:DDB1- and CUL4-associated factor 4-like [Liolophura sinensis]|uniref:DDB1- and CUL4-associated factor 4-like n=1 Tax=Liolophura sinensis TaxID=3198878 RepID=UPI0031583B63